MQENKLAIFEEKEIRREWYKDNWKGRGAKDRDYAILTDEIYKSTFDLNTAQYKELKGINKTKRNLRDGMGKLELQLQI